MTSHQGQVNDPFPTKNIFDPEPSVASKPSSSMASDDEHTSSVEQRLSTFERVFSTHAPILESLLLQAPTDTIFQLYHVSRYLRDFLRFYPTAWQYLSFRLLFPSGTQTRPLTTGTDGVARQRQSRPYALDQLLHNVVIPFSPCLRSLDLDNTAISGQNLTSTVMNMRRDTLEHLSVRGCKNVSLKYHIIPYLTMFGLQHDADVASGSGSAPKFRRLALKSLYTYRCRHHRRRPYLSSSLHRRDSDSEPTHELVKLCHKLGIWTDTAWCTTPAGRCFRRRGYVTMRVPQGTPEVWVVFDRLWRSKNWIGSIVDRDDPPTRDGRLWEHDETGCLGEALGTPDGPEYGEGKTVPAHLRRSHTHFVENIKCDSCSEDISERCEQCSVLMHCVGCRKTLCGSCAFDRPYHRVRPDEQSSAATESFWWAPGATISPSMMQEPNPEQTLNADNNPNNPNNNDNNNNNNIQNAQAPTYPSLKFHWCCTEPMFTGGGGISIGAASREVDRVRAAPLPRGQGWEDPEYSTNEWSKSFPRYAYGDPRRPDYTLAEGHAEMMRWLLGPPNHQASNCPRNLCQECFDSPQWKVHCKSCSRPLCMEHDLRGLRLRICGYRDLVVEKMAIGNPPSPSTSNSAPSVARPPATTFSPQSMQTSVPALGTTLSSQSSNNPASAYEAYTSHASPSTNFIADRDSPPHSPSSTSNNHTRSSSPASVYYEASPENPKWLGCQSFFCPQYRAVGDNRNGCASIVRECTSCSVYVCQDCVSANPPCTCTYCDANFQCPNCQRVKERDGTCRRLEEERIKREEKQKHDMEMFEVTLKRNLANEVAAFAGQFFDQLLLEESNGASSASEGVENSEAEIGEGMPDQQTSTNDQVQTPASNGPGIAIPIPANQPVIGDDDDHAGSSSDHTEILGEEA